MSSLPKLVVAIFCLASAAGLFVAQAHVFLLRNHDTDAAFVQSPSKSSPPGWHLPSPLEAYIAREVGNVGGLPVSDAAIGRIESALRESPMDPHLWNALSTRAFYSNQPQKAEFASLQALSLAPYSVEIALGQAILGGSFQSARTPQALLTAWTHAASLAARYGGKPTKDYLVATHQEEPFCHWIDTHRPFYKWCELVSQRRTICSENQRHEHPGRARRCEQWGM